MSVREVSEGQTIPKAEFVFARIGMAMDHNYLCAVCREDPAVLETWHGILQPCWHCQKRGFRLVRLNWIERFIRKFLNNPNYLPPVNY